MTQITDGMRALLSSPFAYTAFQSLMGARKGWRRFIDEYVRPVEGMSVLDIGCGPGDMLDYLPPVDYWGFDISDSYIAHARKKFGTRGRFYCKLLLIDELQQMPLFDLVVASGVLHHMDDETAKSVLLLAWTALKPGGRLITIDPCWVEGQHPVARALIARDRGQNVRNEAGYGQLVSPLFCNRKIVIKHKAWIPYTHCIMECQK